MKENYNEMKEGSKLLKRKINRKDFLKLTAEGLMGAAALMMSKPYPVLGEGGNNSVRYSMVIDLRRCVGCEACTIACKQENLTPPGIFYNVVYIKEEGKYPKVRRSIIPRPCMHCEQPACLKACPVQAIYKREDGIVIIDYDKCIGAQKCVEACPYGAITFDEGNNYPQSKTEFGKIASKEFKGKYGVRRDEEPPIYRSRKCTFCVHKQDERGNYTSLPACVQTCMGKARFFGNLNDPNSEVAQLLKKRKYIILKPEAGTKPSVFYLI